MAAVRCVGNHLNAHRADRGGAQGFKLDILPKLDFFKSTDNQTTLLAVLAKWIEQHRPELVEFVQELGLAEAAGEVSEEGLVAAEEEGGKAQCTHF